jgi:hypothetical protein
VAGSSTRLEPSRHPRSCGGDGRDDIAGSGDSGDDGGDSGGEGGAAGHDSGVQTTPHPRDDRAGDTIGGTDGMDPESGGGSGSSAGAGTASADLVEADPWNAGEDSAGLAGRRRSVVAIPDLAHRPDDVVTVVKVLMTAATAVWEPPSAHPVVMVVPMQSITLAGQTTAAALQAAVRLAISTSGFVIRLDTNGSRPGSMLPPAGAPTSPTSSHAIATHPPLGHLL